VDATVSAGHHPVMRIAVAVAAIAALSLPMGCPPPDDDGAEGEGEGEPQDSTEQLDAGTDPCVRLDAWPFSTTSATHPLRVHWRARAEEPVAQDVLRFLDEAWTIQVDGLGLPAPITDELGGGEFGCGPDERIDVFLFRGIEEAYVDVVVENTDTPIEDYGPYMVIDAFGDYGGEFLRPTVFHEFNHMTQAALDWLDAANIYEMSATFVEEAVIDSHDSWEFTIFDVTDNPDWSIDRDDGYETFFMYGQALYLIFLQHAVFDGDIDFFVQMWRGLASPAGEPPYQDALDVILADKGLTFLDTVPRYARWMAYVGDRDDGAHFPRGGLYPDVFASVVEVSAATTTTVRPMVLGSAHIDVDAAGPVTVALEGTLPADVELVVQQVPGTASDGDVLTLPATVPAGSRLVVTVMPTAPYSVFSRSDDEVPVTLALAPAAP
jgi:hypothetical protein